MKKILIILFICFNIIASASTYYVATDGNDSNPGTITEPWKTWGKAFNETVTAGDTVYFRGGIYYKDVADGDDDWYYPVRSANGTGYNITRDGAIGDTIYYLAYPGETPILDCKNVTPVANLNYGIRANGVNYVKFRGLTIRNVLMYDDNDQIFGWALSGTGTIVENCKIYRAQGHGFECLGGYPLYYKNCDVYNIIDSLWAYPGERGTGFYSENISDYNSEIYYIGCRAWACSDQGFAHHDIGYVEFNGCWSFDNGRLTAVGSGFKPGFAPHGANPLSLNRKFVNCVTAFNKRYGINLNDNNYPALAYELYNTIAYKNVYGYAIYNTEDSDAEELARIFRNNIAYDNSSGAVFLTANALYTHDHNSWDIPIALQSTDFVSLDSTGITAARQSDGSLPNNDCYNYFLRLSDLSQAIDKGTDTISVSNVIDSTDFYGTEPDIGAFEFNDYEIPPHLPELSTIYPVIIAARTVYTGGYLIDDYDAPITAKGVCYNTVGTPTTADAKVSGGTGSADFSVTLINLNANTTYYIRSYATNASGTGYGAEYTITTDKWNFLKYNNKIVTYGGKPVISK